MLLCGILLLLLAIMWIRIRNNISREKKMIMTILAIAGLLGLAIGVAEMSESILEEGNLLRRNPNGEGEYDQELALTIDGYEEQLEYSITVPEQLLLKEEEEVYLEAAMQDIVEEFPGKNASINEIREGVVIREEYQEGRVLAEWGFDDYQIMDMSGNVVAESIPEEGVLVKARVTLTCGGSGMVEEFYFRVFPVVLSEKEQILKQIAEAIDRQVQKPGEEYLQLPEALGEYTLTWSVPIDHTPEQILLLGIIAAILVPVAERSRKLEEIKKRRALLELEYPDIVSKMAILISAGMTLQGSFRKIAFAYEQKRREQMVPEMPAYEEMLITCRQMENGMGEGTAYEHFGERCGVSEYRKLGAMLAANLRKGSKGITELLEQEAEQAFQNRKSAARRYGEEAGTKLLLPMMIMLGTIMAVLMIPAILTFQM